MRALKFFLIVAVIISLSLLCSCTKGASDLKVKISPSDESLIELASRVYDNSQLSEIIEFNGPISELNTKYPIECLRDDSGVYRVSYLGDGNIAILLFDSSGNRLSGNIYSTKLLRSDFSVLAEGQSLEDVRNIDSDGEYLFLYSGRNDTPKVSSHYTKDGYIITIEYDDSNTIISINEELI